MSSFAMNAFHYRCR